MYQEIRIRDARLEEHPAMLDLTLAAYQQYAPILPHWPFYQQMQRNLLITDTVAERIVAEHNDALVGSVLLFPAEANVYTANGSNANWPELRMLAVAPEHRGMGVGRALLDECIRRAQAIGSAYLGLHTEETMAIALGMYRRAGFVRRPELDIIPAPGILVMGYRLTL